MDAIEHENPLPSARAALRTRLKAERQAWLASPAGAQAPAGLAAQLAPVMQQLEPLCLGLYWPLPGEFDAPAYWAAHALPGVSLALRLRVKLADALPARWRPADAPWDAGYLADDPAVRAALRQFRPRRPTLIVSDPMPEAALQASLEALHAAAPGFARPVRLLVQPG